MRRLAHLINPVRAGRDSDLFVAQPITFATMRAARAFARGRVEVELLSAQYADEHDLVPDAFRPTADLRRSVLDTGCFDMKRRLPLIRDLLDRLHDESDAEYLVYTNADIALTPHFYVTVDALLDEGYDGLVVNRRTISADYLSADPLPLGDIPLMYAELGRPHEGHDCFVFHRAAYPRFRLGSICIGIARVGRVLVWNVLGHARRFEELADHHLTFHIGQTPAAWQRGGQDDYVAHNHREARRVLAELEQAHGPDAAARLVARYPLEFDIGAIQP